MIVNLKAMSDIVQTNGHLFDGFVPRVEGKHVGVVVTSCRVGLNKVILSVLLFWAHEAQFLDERVSPKLNDNIMHMRKGSQA